MQFKKLGFATFEGGPTFWRSLLSGFTIGTLWYIKRVVY